MASRTVNKKPRNKPKLLVSKKEAAQRLAALEAEIAKKNLPPIDDAYLDEMGTVWPADESVDEFIAWYRKGRRTGRYD